MRGIVSTIIVTGLSVYMIVFTVIIVYRVIQDDASGCRSLLYLNNVTTGVYTLALFVFSTLLMVGVSVICLLIIFITNIVSTSKLFSIALSLLIGSLETALCTLFLAILINSRWVFVSSLIHSTFAVIVVIAVNVIGYGAVSSASLGSTSILMAAIPGY